MLENINCVEEDGILDHLAGEMVSLYFYVEVAPTVTFIVMFFSLMLR